MKAQTMVKCDSSIIPRYQPGDLVRLIRESDPDYYFLDVDTHLQLRIITNFIDYPHVPSINCYAYKLEKTKALRITQEIESSTFLVIQAYNYSSDEKLTKGKCYQCNDARILPDYSKSLITVILDGQKATVASNFFVRVSPNIV